MAELAAGALAVEQVVSTGIQAGAAVAVAKPAQPFKASLSRIATSPAEDTTYVVTNCPLPAILTPQLKHVLTSIAV